MREEVEPYTPDGYKYGCSAGSSTSRCLVSVQALFAGMHQMAFFPRGTRPV